MLFVIRYRRLHTEDIHNFISVTNVSVCKSEQIIQKENVYNQQRALLKESSAINMYLEDN